VLPLTLCFYLVEVGLILIFYNKRLYVNKARHRYKSRRAIQAIASSCYEDVAVFTYLYNKDIYFLKHVAVAVAVAYKGIVYQSVVVFA
jgi:hypothetical protein